MLVRFVFVSHWYRMFRFSRKNKNALVVVLVAESLCFDHRSGQPVDSAAGGFACSLADILLFL